MPKTEEQKARDREYQAARRAAKKAAAIEIETTPEPPAPTPENTVEDITAIDRMSLYRMAKEERKARGDSDGPYMAELNRRRAGAHAGKVSTPKRDGRTGRAIHPLMVDATARKTAAANHRGAGRKPEPGELTALAVKYHGEGLTENQGLTVAYWVDGVKVSRGTWAPAWAAVTGEEHAVGS